MAKNTQTFEKPTLHFIQVSTMTGADFVEFCEEITNEKATPKQIGEAYQLVREIRRRMKVEKQKRRKIKST